MLIKTIVMREEEKGFQRTQAFTAQKSSLGLLTNLISAGL
jgi:hypothetical protein